jgi:hypothetical protein
MLLLLVSPSLLNLQALSMSMFLMLLLLLQAGVSDTDLIHEDGGLTSILMGDATTMLSCGLDRCRIIKTISGCFIGTILLQKKTQIHRLFNHQVLSTLILLLLLLVTSALLNPKRCRCRY